MKIFTSYYKKIDNDIRGLVPVRVSTSEPNWFSWELETMPELYPGWDLVNGIKSGELTKEEYTVRYKQKLAKLNKEEIIKKLERFSKEWGGRDIVLLCYENRDGFCHRHIIAEWIGGVEELE